MLVEKDSSLLIQKKILNYYGIEIDIAELFKIQIIQWQNHEKHKRLAIRLNVYQPSINNGRTLLIIGAAALGFGVALALGAGLATAIAIGAAIGYRLLRGNQQQRRQDTRQQRVVNAAGFDSVPAPPQIGGTIPLIYCNSSVNPSGGLRISSSVVFSRIVTLNNKQNLRMLRILGLGTIATVNSTKLLLDNQPITNFLQDEIVTQYSTGATDQPRFENVPFYSQSASTNSSNTIGLSARGKVVSSSGNTFTVSADDFDNFTPSENYEANNQEFRIINKSAPNNQIFLNRQVNLPTNTQVFAKFETKFKTQKRCSQLEINLVANVWARNKDSELIKFGAAFSLYINDVFIHVLYIANSKEGDVRRAFTLKNLALKQHNIRLQPIYQPSNNLPYSRLDDSGVVRDINTNVTVDGKQVILSIESKPENAISFSDLTSIFEQNNKPQKSSDRGATVRVTSFNQIVYPQDIGQSSITNYPGLKLAYNDFTGSDRLTGAPATSDFVEEATQYRNHLAAGKASPTSAGNRLLANGIDLSQLTAGNIVRNITRRIESVITAINGAEVISRDSLNWREGDVFLGYFWGSITYYPDVYVHTLLDKNCLGYTLSELYINYQLICRSRKFCVERGYFFNDAIESVTNWDEWAARESMASLLFPTDFSGVYGLLPETYTEPVSVFSATNIMPGTYRESPPENKTINSVQLTYNAREDDNFYKKTITCLTQDAYLGIEPLKLEAIEYESISRTQQAKDVAGRYLKSRLVQNKVIQFKTGLQGFTLEAGDLIIVQYSLTESEAEFSGFCLEAGALTNGTQQIELSRTQNLDPTSRATVYHLQTGAIEKNLPVISTGTNLVISELSSVIQPKTALYNGDIVIINKDISKKIFRVTNIKAESYAVSVYAINWAPDILNNDGLYFVE